MYNNQTGDILTSDEINTYNYNFYDTSWITFYEQNNVFTVLPQRKPHDQNLTLPFFLDTKANYDVITIIYPITTYSNSRNDGAVIINLYKNSIASLNSIYDDNYFILDPMGTIIASIADKDLVVKVKKSKEFADIMMSKNNLGYTDLSLEQDNYLLMYQRSLTTNFTYMKLTSINTLYSLLNRAQYILIFLTIFIILAGVLYSLYTTQNFYNPVERIMNQLKVKQITPSFNRQNELNFIYKAVDFLIEEDQKITKLLSENKNNIEKSYVLELLRGKIDEKSSSLFKEPMLYCCILLSIDQYKQFIEKYSYRDQYSFKTILLCLAEEHINTYGKGIGILLENDKIAVVTLLNPITLDEATTTINKIAHTLIKKTSRFDTFSISISIGNIYDNINSIHCSFLEALQALKYRMTYGYRSIIPYNSLLKNVKETNLTVPNLVHPLANNDEENIESLLHQFFSKLKNIGSINNENIMNYLYPMISTIMDFLNKNNLTMTQISHDYYSIYNKILEKITLDEIQEELFSLCKNIISYRQQLAHESNYIQRILLFINNHYMDSNLDINKISDNIGISYSYIRKLIKEETGTNVIHYINNLRIQASKDLLIQTDLKVKDIALAVGYNTDQSYSRYFKKYENMTPGEYRKIHK